MENIKWEKETEEKFRKIIDGIPDMIRASRKPGFPGKLKVSLEMKIV